MSSVAHPPPEQGQLVAVRSRNWMVTDVSASTLPAERLRTGLEPPQHLVSLSSVEDDGLGEELHVVWELEPGARVVEKVALPDPTGFDPPERLDAFLDAGGHRMLTTRPGVGKVDQGAGRLVEAIE